MHKPVVSALPNLLPIQVVNMGTGELLTWSDLVQSDLTLILDWVLDETNRMYQEHETLVLESARTLRFNAAEHARQAGLNSHHMGLSRGVKSKSRLNKLVQYKLLSETASYVLNPNPRKQPHKFSRVLNLGAVDSQMTTLNREEERLILTWKCWENEYELTFLIPHYIQSRPITKWSLPTVSGRGFVFSYQESPLSQEGKRVAGVDLGRVEPFTLAILGGRESDRGVQGETSTKGNKLKA